MQTPKLLENRLNHSVDYVDENLRLPIIEAVLYRHNVKIEWQENHDDDSGQPYRWVSQVISGLTEYEIIAYIQGMIDGYNLAYRDKN